MMVDEEEEHDRMTLATFWQDGHYRKTKVLICVAAPSKMLCLKSKVSMKYCNTANFYPSHKFR